MTQPGAWWHRPLETAPSVRALRLGERTALFCGRTQRLSELNETAALAWRALAESGSCEAVAERLRAAGASPEEGEAFAVSIVRQWLKLGYVAPAWTEDARSNLPAVTLAIGIGPMAADLRFYGTANGEAARAAFGHLERCRPAQAVQFDVVGLEDEDVIFQDGASHGLAPPTQTVPRLKAMLTALYCAQVDDGFLAHAALVSARGKRVLLSGQPGAGKTTLTLALCASGFAYGSDDIVHVGADGRAQGAPFAAAAKSGAWPALAPYWPKLGDVTTHLRGDGHLVRYLNPQRRDLGGAKPIDVMLVLDRRAENAAKLEPIEPREALCLLLASGYAERGGVDGGTLEALAQDLSRSVCARLIYKSVEEGVALVQRLVDE